MKKMGFGCLVGVLLIGWAGWAQGVTRYYISPSGNWDTDANWTGGVEPTSADDLFIGNLALPLVAAVTIDQAGEVANSLYVGGDDGANWGPPNMSFTETGTVTMASGNLTVTGALKIGGYTATGRFIQNGGAVTAQSVTVSATYGGIGDYQLNAGRLKVTAGFSAGTYGGPHTARFTMGSGTTLEATTILLGGVTLAPPPDANISVSSWFYIGVNTLTNYSATFTQAGSNNTKNVGSVAVAAYSANVGTYNVYCQGARARGGFACGTTAGSRGTVNIASNGTLTVGNGINGLTTVFGNSTGKAQLNLGDAVSAGYLIGTWNDTFYVRQGASSTVEVRGVGGLRPFSMPLHNNGRIVADAWGGAERTLEVTGIITNSIENGVAESNGWYAVRGGRLQLPKITVATGNNAYNWGESAADTTIDLVNSMRFSFTNVTGGGAITNALLALDRSDAPRPATVAKAVSAHQLVSPPSFAFGAGGGIALTVRYDAYACQAQGYSEPDMFQVYDSTVRLLPVLASDPANRRLTVWVSALHGTDVFLLGQYRPLGTAIMIR